VLAEIVGALLEIGDLLQPFMPATSDKIRQIFASGLLSEMPAPLFPKHQIAK
jgi:methionyl-tRNA synthetase